MIRANSQPGATGLHETSAWVANAPYERHNQGLIKGRMKRAKGVGLRALAQRWLAVTTVASSSTAKAR